jgi:hypothetical protein
MRWLIGIFITYVLLSARGFVYLEDRIQKVEYRAGLDGLELMGTERMAQDRAKQVDLLWDHVDRLQMWKNGASDEWIQQQDLKDAAREKRERKP